jgi:hypothetical protein
MTHKIMQTDNSDISMKVGTEVTEEYWRAEKERS